jgi:pSer/pThr/pTyr-binding forkhead associated (FHA) protein
MIECKECHHLNRNGTLFCEECGKSLVGLPINATIPTRAIQADVDEASAKSTWGTAHVKQGTALVLRFLNDERPLIVPPTRKVVFGRLDAGSTVSPDIDLTPYGAIEKGVSRQHAVIEFSEDTLILLDAGSSNGTFLNGQRLLPNQPRVLRDGDEVRFGKLVAHIYFK